MAKKEFILALDIGTTSVKGLLYNIGGDVKGVCSRTYKTFYPAPGMAEQDADEVLRGVVEVVSTLMNKHGLSPSFITALVFGGALHSILPVDSKGVPIGKAMIWADFRAEKQSKKLRKELDIELIRRRTGCSIQPMYFLPRLLWLKENYPDQVKKTFKFISLKEYVIFRFFGDFFVDRSVASGTGLFNNTSMDWDQELLDIAGIKKSMFSSVVETTHLLSDLKKEFASKMTLLPGTRGVIGGSDGPSAHLGCAGLDPTRMSMTVGTSGALRRLTYAPASIPGTEAWCYYLTEGYWLLGGVAHDTGIVIRWFSKEVMGENTSKAFEIIENEVPQVPPGADGLMFFPFLGGEKTPHYIPSARGALLGMTFSHSRAHILRALMEGIAYKLFTVYRMLDPAEEKKLVVTGGILKSPTWLNITANFLGKELFKPGVEEASAWGGVLIALKALGVISSPKDMDKFVSTSGMVKSNDKEHRIYEKLLKYYDENYKKLYSNDVKP